MPGKLPRTHGASRTTNSQPDLKQSDTVSAPLRGQRLTEENLRAHTDVQRELRFFGCSSCNRVWYQRVLPYKPVSHCHSCRQAYKAIPLTEEPKGLGHFSCNNCLHRWASHPSVRDIPQPCHACGQENVFAEFVIPDDENGKPRLQVGPRKSNYRHKCNACKDFAPNQMCPVNNRKGNRCSEPHESTGSTISLGSNDATRILCEVNVPRYSKRMHVHGYAPDEITFAQNGAYPVRKQIFLIPTPYFNRLSFFLPS